jgi:prophage maintenance system killer protein
MAAKSRLDVAAVRARLLETQRDFKQINQHLTVEKTPPSDEVINNLVAGYALIDRYLRDGIDLFAYGSSYRLLELNHTVLYEHADISKDEDKSQFSATQDYFYETKNGGIGQLMTWLELHNRDSVWKRAAGIFTYMISQPQLFLEGNHRTGSLIMSYMLMREGHGPFVLTVDNARFYFEPAELTKKRNKHNIIDDLLHLPKQTKKFAKLLKHEHGTDYMLKKVVQ